MPAPSSSVRVTVPPEKIVAVAWLVVSVSDPAAPVAVEIADPAVPGSLPLRARSEVSPVAPLIQVFCRISSAEVRVLAIVQSHGDWFGWDLIGAALSTRARGEPVRGSQAIAEV